MVNAMARNVAAVIGGVLVATLVIFVVEAAGHAIFPPPEALDLSDPANQARLMELAPIEARIAVAVAWFLGALAGACAAIAVSRRILMGWIVGLVIALLSVWTTRMFPHPDWMLAAGAVLPLVAVLVAKRLMVRQIDAA